MIEPQTIEDREHLRQVRAAQVTISGIEPSIPGQDDLAIACSRLLASASKFPSRSTEEEAAEHRTKVQGLRMTWNAPKRHLETELRRDVSEWSKAFETIKGKIGTGFIVALVGTRGPGKTQMGVELMKESTDRLRTTLFCTAMDFFLDVKGTYDDGSKMSEKEAIRIYGKTKFLVIDEIQERGQTPWEDRLLGHLINRRYNDKSDTLLISNLKRQEFEQSLGASIISRLNETGGIIECGWASFRD